MVRALIILILMACGPLTFASETSASQRSYRLGFSANHFTNQISTDTNQTGLGLVGVYEFHLNPRFTLGIDLELRHLGGEAPWSQLGYGLLMKHFLSASEKHTWMPYLEYGLLMSVSRQRGVEGAGTAHDTRLAAGLEGPWLGRTVFVDLSYHYSRLEFFNVEKKNLDYVQINFGWKFDRN